MCIHVHVHVHVYWQQLLIDLDIAERKDLVEQILVKYTTAL